MTLKFRNKFAKRVNLGSKRKYLSVRTLKDTFSTKCTDNILLVDLDYIDSLLSKDSISDRIQILNWIESFFCRLLPTRVHFIASTKSSYSSSIVSEMGFPVAYAKYIDYSYTLRIATASTNVRLFFVTNQFTSWILSSDKNTNYVAIDSNNRLLIYNNSTGLEFLSRLISTNKLMNKLKLDNMKYMNLQYLYCLLLYVKVTHGAKDSNFFFDALYFKTKQRDKFSNSKGLGLSMLTEAHKFLSYLLLTKPEYMDYFLFNSVADLEMQLKRLLKISAFDSSILTYLHMYYANNLKPSKLPIASLLSGKISSPINSTPTISSYSSILALSPVIPLRAFEERRRLAWIFKLSRIVELSGNLYPLLPKERIVLSRKSENFSEPFMAPEISDNILSYVDSLFNDRFAK